MQDMLRGHSGLRPLHVRTHVPLLPGEQLRHLIKYLLTMCSSVLCSSGRGGEAASVPCVVNPSRMSLRSTGNDTRTLKHNCQAQGPTQGPTQGQGQGQGQDMVWSWSGQVRSDSNSNSNSNVGPELYTKIGFHPPTTPSLNECLVNFVTLCDSL